MSIAIAIIGALGLLSGLLAILFIRAAKDEDSGAAAIAIGLFGAIFAIVSWVCFLVLLAFFSPHTPLILIPGILATIFPLLPFVTTGRFYSVLTILGWLSALVFYILLLAL